MIIKETKRNVNQLNNQRPFPTAPKFKIYKNAYISMYVGVYVLIGIHVHYYMCNVTSVHTHTFKLTCFIILSTMANPIDNAEKFYHKIDLITK